MEQHRPLKLGNSLFMAISYTEVHFLPILPSSSILNNHLKCLMSLLTWFQKSENAQAFFTSSLGFQLGFQHLGSSVALPILSQKHQERWGHSRGSAATESKVLAEGQIDQPDRCEGMETAQWAINRADSPSAATIRHLHGYCTAPPQLPVRHLHGYRGLFFERGEKRKVKKNFLLKNTKGYYWMIDLQANFDFQPLNPF